MLFAPPQVWTPSPEEASATLSMVSSLVRSGTATARPFAEFVAAAAATADDPIASALSYPEQAITDGASAEVLTIAAEQPPRLDALQAAMVEDPQAQLTPQEFLAPLREDCCARWSSAGRRGHPAGRPPLRICALWMSRWPSTACTGVSILSPGGVYTLASEQSPLLLVARNDLPVGITVQLGVDAPAA